MTLFNLFHRDRLGPSYSAVSSSGTLDELEQLTSKMSAWALKEHNEDGTHNITPSGFDFVPIGAMMDWPTDTPPTRWLVCDGSQKSRTTYAALYLVIGTTFGAGDGSTTFNLPDYRGRSPLGKATSGTGSTLGGTIGSLDHTHSVPALSVPALSIPALSIPALSVSITTDSQGSHSHTGSTGAASGQTLNAFSVGTGAAQYAFNLPGDFGHTHSIGSDGSHTHSVSGSTGTGSSGTGSTGTGSTGTGTSGSSNHACLVVNRIILAGI